LAHHRYAARGVDFNQRMMMLTLFFCFFLAELFSVPPQASGFMLHQGGDFRIRPVDQ